MTHNDQTIDILEDLIQTCRDGQEGYRTAAEHTRDPEVKAFFEHQSLQRAGFAGELENVVERLGKSNPERDSSLKGKLRRAWIDMKETLGGGDLSILESVEAGEDNAKRAYQQALTAKLPADIIEIVDRQAQSVLAAHDQARALRDRFRHAA